MKAEGDRGHLAGGVMLETRSARAADSVWASKPLPAPHAMANTRHGKNAQVQPQTMIIMPYSTTI